MEGWVITAHGTNDRIVDRILARALEDPPGLIVVAEADSYSMPAKRGVPSRRESL